MKKIKAFLKKHQKYGPLSFFIIGFIWDSLTLGRIDRLYDRTILTSYLILLSFCLYAFNLKDDGKWKGTKFGKYEEFLPLAIQFFLGGLSSAYVIYFSRSVSLSKTAFFFLILVVLLVANELLRSRISNKYLQFSAYFFVSFVYFSFMIPVVINKMNTTIFLLSGVVSLITTFLLVVFIHRSSPSTRKELHLPFQVGFILSLYFFINTLYYFNMIPPVPLALQNAIAAHSISVSDHKYHVTYEPKKWYQFWRNHKEVYHHTEGESIYVFSSIFAPTSLEKKVAHRWLLYNRKRDEWEQMDYIDFEIIGGRDEGFRGYSVKQNIYEGLWEVQVVTEEDLVLGVIDFEVVINKKDLPINLITKSF